MTDPVESNAFYVGFTRHELLHCVHVLKDFARTIRATLVLDSIEGLFSGLSDRDFDTSDNDDTDDETNLDDIPF